MENFIVQGTDFDHRKAVGNNCIEQPLGYHRDGHGDTAKLTGPGTRSVNTIFLKIRRGTAQYCDRVSPYSGEVELDEFYFGPKFVRGKRGCGAGAKLLSSLSLNSMIMSIPKLSRMLAQVLYCL